MNFGDWEGVPWSDIDPAQINAWADDIVGYRVPGGERFQDVLDRVGEFLSELPGEDNLLITHSGVIKACWALRGGLSVEVAAKRSMGFGDYLSIP
jgi:alpha-ribazole phosphatase